MNINLKELLKKDFDFDLPISGGTGNSIDNAIIISKTAGIHYVGLENTILSCLGKGRKIEWRRESQQLLEIEGRKIDKIKIKTIWLSDDKVIQQIENYYFDITECFSNS